MMIDSFISNSLRSRGEPEYLANPKQVDAIRKTIETNFGVNLLGDCAPWDNKDGPGGVLLTDGWRMITDYVGDATCVLFARNADKMWIMENGSSLLALLEDTPPFELYVCDLNPTYLLCHNDHDFLIGWGRAEEWVATL